MNSRLLFLRRFTSGRHRPGAPQTTPGSRANTLLRGVGFTASLTTAYTVGSLYPPDLARFISPRAASPPPLFGTPEAKAHTETLEDRLQNLPLLRALRSREDKQDWYESRPYTEIPDEVRVNNLTAGALSGPGKLAVRPLIRVKNDESEAWAFIHVGRGLCGHDGIVHGGLMATLLDESMGRLAFFNLPNRIGVTGNLTLNYRAPTKADQFVVIKCKLESQEGRKAVVSSRVEDMQGNVLIEASSIFIEPKYANSLKATSSVGVLVGTKVEPPVSASA
ncbi:Thioesterase/thiol ester dehydrase-isomerase [Thelephora ganbajun]|uniref:Thioesterase/thiol ester dehydrase-isomerase n=1 Tax=Thelephora ganbajun TaxID=370292 RepID=A0ACB6ZSS3_THEGA|nr:Thioesterase/thiol ester dehydrase-isomerase [Thelephora ganbajun]